MALQARIASAVAFVMRLKPVRVFVHYGQVRGPLLAQGLSYQAIFAVFAGLWLAFAVAGFVIRGDPRVLDALLDVLATSVPGLIGDDGAIDADRLLSASILGWTGAIAAAGLLFTALGWLASGREAVRSMFGMPGPATNFLLLKLKDLGLAVGFGAVVLVSAALSVASTAALEALLRLVGIDDDSLAAVVGGRALGLAIMFVIDAVLLGAFYRVLSGIRIPLRLLAPGTILAAAALGALKALGSSLLGGATSNPLLAGFAVIIGLLIWFNLVCQVILIGSAWISVSAADGDVDLTAHQVERGEPSGTAAAL
ncbi:MAG TPA: YihY/virulence factor BrkB family protein [Rhodoglobus sp.]|nr:YihY/virulence factor BrkB family protein [Rhodoglobus sp.]